jgi:hypothetical protein
MINLLFPNNSFHRSGFPDGAFGRFPYLVWNYCGSGGAWCKLVLLEAGYSRRFVIHSRGFQLIPVSGDSTLWVSTINLLCGNALFISPPFLLKSFFQQWYARPPPGYGHFASKLQGMFVNLNYSKSIPEMIRGGI